VSSRGGEELEAEQVGEVNVEWLTLGGDAGEAALWQPKPAPKCTRDREKLARTGMRHWKQGTRGQLPAGGPERRVADHDPRRARPPAKLWNEHRRRAEQPVR